MNPPSEQQIRALYQRELRLVEELSLSLQTEDLGAAELRSPVQEVATHYHELLERVIKLTLVSDALQLRLKATERNLSQTLEHVNRLNRNLRALNEEKDEILALAAHDFRSPLAGIQGLAELLAEGEAGDEQESRALAREIADAAANLLNMVTHVLDCHQGGASTVGEHSLARVNLGTLCDRLHAKARAEARRKSIELDFDPGDAQLVVTLEEILFERAVDNLVHNALKFTPVGGRIIVRFCVEGRWLHFSVEDTGPGISEEDRERLFKKFAELSARPTAGEFSAGLGLNIVHRIVTHLGGEVVCESRLGQGAMFAIKFPIVSD